MKSITKVDEHTVRFTLNQPNAAFLADMAMQFSSILSKEYADQLLKAGDPEQMNQQPVGTGPFQLLNYQKDAAIRYQRNPDYWGKAPAIKNLIFVITPEAAVRYQKLRAGECQVMVYPNPSDIASLKKDSQIKLMSQPGLNIGYLAFNTKKKPLDNVQVRQALSYAVNRKSIINAIFRGHAQIASNPIPPTMLGYNPDVKTYAYDPDKAKALLKKAGYPNGFSTDLWAMPVSSARTTPTPGAWPRSSRPTGPRSGSRPRSRPMNGASISSALAQGDHQTAFAWAGPATTAIRTISCITLLGCPGVNTGNNYRPLVQQEIHKTRYRGPEDHRRGQAQEAVSTGHRGVQATGAVADHRSFDGVRAHAERRGRLCHGSAGRALFSRSQRRRLSAARLAVVVVR